MKPIIQTCQPRSEVLQGELRDDIFAARLRDVMEDHAEEVYGTPSVFFENTFPTDGLRELLSEVFGRLTGKKPNASPILRLETSFGGGKTHNLIALYHVAKNKVAAKTVQPFLDTGLLPSTSIGLVAGVVGSDMEPAVGFLHSDTGIRTFTLAGEIAHQLRGREGYDIVRAADEGKTAIGTKSFDSLIGDEPCLIMLDEMGRFMRDASSIPTPGNPKVNLAETSVATLLSLFEFASSKANVSVVLTLADSSDAFGKETDMIRQELAEAKKVSARQERVLNPSNEVEMSAIVTHRLFQKIDREAAEETVREYAALYERVYEKESALPLPDRVRRAEYLDEMRKDYPFHPSFLRTLRRKTSTIPSFQQTRGALRLLARSIRAAWDQKRAGMGLFHIHDLDFGIDDIANDLTSRLERPHYRQVIEADLVSPKKGSLSHAQELDAGRVADGKPPYAYRLASAIFLHSLTQGIASGVDSAELAEAVLCPGDEPSYLKRVLAELEDCAWFLEFDGDKYRFKTEPSLNKLIADEAQTIPTTRAKQELEERIRAVWKKGTLHPFYFPSEASQVDDDAGDPKLAVLHFDAATANETDEGQVAPELVLRLFEHAGSMEGYRSYKNNVVFLVADFDHIDRMVEQMRRYLAINRIVGDPARMAEFTKDQREKLKVARDGAELDVRVAITRAYRFLYYPTEDAPKKSRGLRRHTLPAQDQGDVKSDQSQVVLRVLKGLGKVLTSDDQPKAPAWLKAKAWPMNQTYVATEEVRKEFARRISLPLLLDINQLKKTIKSGIQAQEWVYYVAEEQVAYGASSPPPLIVCSDDTALYEVAEAKSQGFKIKGETDVPGTECPVCHKSPCKCADDLDEPQAQTRLHAEGAPSQAFQRLSDLCAEHKIARLRTIFVKVEGSGATGARELKSVGLAIPQMGKGLYRLEQSLTCEFAEDETLSVGFKGSWDRYKRLKQVTDAFAGESKKLHMGLTLRADFPDGLDITGPQFSTIRDVLAGLELGKVLLDARRVEETKG
jgi:predicted AAA+ superfamily ATPase